MPFMIVTCSGNPVILAFSEQVPTATTLLKFRYLFEKHEIGKKLFNDITVRLDVAGSGYIHTIIATPANVNDVAETSSFLRPDDEVVYGDSGYLSVAERNEIKQDAHLRKIEYHVDKRPFGNKCPDSYREINWDKKLNMGSPLFAVKRDMYF